jgi:hypothetical protein
MKFSQFEHEFLPHVLIPLIGGLFVLAAMHSAARAETGPSRSGGASFIVSAADGYGVNDCIKSHDDCAKIVADAWCEAHGLSSAKAYGAAGDVTGAIEKASTRPAPAKVIGEDDVFISCGE